MSRQPLLASIVLALALALAACSKASHEEASTDAGAAMTQAPSMVMDAAAASADAGTTAELSAKADEPPTEHRADRKASTEITKVNYKSELTKLAKDLGTP